MIAHNTQGRGMSDLAENSKSSLPLGTMIEQIAFVNEPGQNQPVLVEIAPPLARRAVLLQSRPAAESAALDGELSLLVVPAASRDLDPERESEILAQMREWVEAATPGCTASHLLTLQNVRIFWSPERIALLAPADRIETVRAALIEATYYETEISSIERQLGTAWPQLEKDMPLAFEFDSSSLPQRKQLRRRFQEVLLLRAKLARLGPHVHCPYIHPPTLASQIGERLRERTRLVHRHEFLTEQLEVFERVYEMCGQKASDFLLARHGHLLEWILIILLFISTMLQMFEIFSNTSASPSATIKSAGPATVSASS